MNAAQSCRLTYDAPVSTLRERGPCHIIGAPNTGNLPVTAKSFNETQSVACTGAVVKLFAGFGFDDAGAFFADGFRLHGHNLLHGDRQLDVLHLESLDFNAPARCRVGDVFTEKTIDFVALLQDLVEIVLSDNI